MRKLIPALILSLLTVELLSRMVDGRGLSTLQPQLNRRVLYPGTVSFMNEGWGISTWGPDGIRQKSSWKPGSVLVMGDSYTEALQVDDSLTYNHLVEQGTGLELLNLGYPGQTIADHIGRAPFYRKYFQPSWTIVQIADTDMDDYAFTANPETYHFERDEQGRLKLIEPHYTAKFGSLERDRQVAELSRWVSLIPATYYRFKALQSRGEPPLFFAGSVKPPPPAPDPASFPIEEELELLIKAYDGRLTVLYLSTRYRPMGHSLPRPIEDRAVSYLRSRGVRVVNTGEMGPLMDSELRSLYGFDNARFNAGHLNAWGHRQVAEKLTRELRELENDGLLQP